MKLAERLRFIEPFYVMECAKTAQQIARSPECDPAQGGRPMLFLNIGEPDFTAPPPVLHAARECLASGRTQYTDATGLPALRKAISRWYGERFDLDVPARRIVVTAGASAALQLVTLALFEPGDEVLMPDPSYPCNRHFVAATGARAVLLESDARGASSSTPTRSSRLERAHARRAARVAIEPDRHLDRSGRDAAHRRSGARARRRGHRRRDLPGLELRRVVRPQRAAVRRRRDLGQQLLEVLQHDGLAARVGRGAGRAVAPIEKLAQNLFICASSVAQHAALACFEAESIAEYERRRAEFPAGATTSCRRCEALRLRVPVVPDGAFYAWADCSAHAASSWDFCFDLMRRAHVALTPGRDFGHAAGERFLRLSYASSMASLEEAVHRLRAAL